MENCPAISSSSSSSSFFQKIFSLPSHSRGCYLITSDVLSQLPEIKTIEIGLLNLFLQHTSASLCINENYDEDVKIDMETTLNRIVPEGKQLYKHLMEGKDDMPAHVKSALIGVSVIIPITKGALNLGTWQGIWLCEHRDAKNSRTIVATIQGKLY